jgi:hypothetical protein
MSTHISLQSIGECNLTATRLILKSHNLYRAPTPPAHTPMSCKIASDSNLI